MNFVTYQVRVYESGTKKWYLNNKLHREDGPAIEYASGTKAWFLNDQEISEAEFNAKMNPGTCDGKIVSIEGVKYKLTLQE